MAAEALLSLTVWILAGHRSPHSAKRKAALLSLAAGDHHGPGLDKAREGKITVVSPALDPPNSIRSKYGSAKIPKPAN